MWQARFYQSLPVIVQEHPKARWLFLTLTVRNMPVCELRDALQHMNKSWQRLIKRKEFKAVQGWIRTTEITRGKDGSAHPHFHILLMVPPSWFRGQTYVKQQRWVELWGDCLQVDYAPTVDIRTVKPKHDGAIHSGITEQLRGAVSETLKYAVKPSDMVDDPDWFLTMTKQVHNLRFIATGGALKNCLRVDDESNDDLIVASEQEAETGDKLSFSWRPTMRHYVKLGV